MDARLILLTTVKHVNGQPILANDVLTFMRGLMKTAAVILITIGIAIVIWAGFGFTTRDKVVDVGPIHATKDTKHDVPYGSVAGAALAIAGAVMLVKST